MITNDLLKYVYQQRSNKTPDEKIKNDLEKTGWKSKDITFALNYDGKSEVPTPPYEQEVKGIEKGYKSIWDAFLHAMMFISMYISTLSFGAILFVLIDYYFPSLRYNNYYNRNDLSAAEFPLSALIVTFPFFIYLFLKITNATHNNPNIRNLMARKVLIYLTLTVTFVTMVITLILVVFGFISGNITTNFGIKTLVVIGLSALIFGYYLNQVKADRKDNA